MCCYRDVDYNPNRPLTVLTCGDDRKLKIWDTRNMHTPLKTMEGHTHWAWTAKYNPFHDQLILRCVNNMQVVFTL
jgi:WD40 repeat protein